jgi:hypothetical protein
MNGGNSGVRSQKMINGWISGVQKQENKGISGVKTQETVKNGDQWRVEARKL